MSDLRTAAKQMLEALEKATYMLAFLSKQDDKYTEAWEELCLVGLIPLRAALAEPFSPEAISTTQTAWKMGYEAGKAERVEQSFEQAGVVTSMVKGGVTWHIWPDQMPDGTTLYAAAPIIKPEIKEDNSVPQAQQFLYNAWADEQIQKEKK